MVVFLARRFVYAATTLLFVSIVGFVIINLPSGSYVDYYLAQRQLMGTNTTQDEIESIKRRYALDRPLYAQYWKWFTGFVRGDFGQSFYYNRDIGELIWKRLGYTALISILSLLFTWIVGLPIGIYSATHQYSAGDFLFTLIGLFGLSIPNFMLALVLMVMARRVFGLSVGGLFSQAYANAPWSMARFLDLLQHLWVPVVIVGASGTAQLVRMMRGNLLDILNMQYVQAARARGLPENVLLIKHAVRNAVHPLVMLLGMSLPSIISGSTVVSIVLSLPTTGPLYFDALRMQDMFLAVTFLMFLSVMLLLGNLLADVLLAWIDPRIRFQ